MAKGRPREFNRDEVLDRALQLFWAQGFTATGLTDLLAHLGIARQSLYYAFGDKKGLYIHAIDRYADTTLQRFIDHLDQPGSPMGNLKGLIQKWRELAQGQGHDGCFIGNAIAELGSIDPELGERLKKHLSRLQEALQQTLSQAQDHGEISAKADPRALSRWLVTLFEGLALLSKIDRDPEVINDILDSTLGFLEQA